MKTSEMLKAIANWLESPNNEAIVISEGDEQLSTIAAESCLIAATALKMGAEKIHSIEESGDPKFNFKIYDKLDVSGASNVIAEFEGTFEDADGVARELAGSNVKVDGLFEEDGGVMHYISAEDGEPVSYLEMVGVPVNEKAVTPESIDMLSEIAAAFDDSNDPELKKSASAIDELLMTIASPPNWLSNFKKAEDKKIDEIKSRYEDARNSIHENVKSEATIKAIEDSPYSQKYEILERALSSRNCPDHAGVQMSRKGDGVWQCELDKKIYDFNNGFKDEKGNLVPGGSVANQGNNMNTAPQSVFDTRKTRLEAF